MSNHSKLAKTIAPATALGPNADGAEPSPAAAFTRPVISQERSPAEASPDEAESPIAPGPLLSVHTAESEASIVTLIDEASDSMSRGINSVDDGYAYNNDVDLESRALLGRVQLLESKNAELSRRIEDVAVFNLGGLFFEQIQFDSLKKSVKQLEQRGSGETILPLDSYSFFVTGGLGGMFFSVLVFIVQLLFLCLLLSDPRNVDWKGNNILKVPYSVSWQVRIAEFLALFLAAITQDDIITFCIVVQKGYAKVGKIDEAKKWQWFLQLVGRILEGVVSLITTFIIIMRGKDVKDVLLTFASLEFVAKLDNISFKLCQWGFFGTELREEARKLIDSEEPRSEDRKRRYCSLQLMIVFVVISCFFGLASLVAKQQSSGEYLLRDYPNCKHLHHSEIHKINNGYCEDHHDPTKYSNWTAHSKYNTKDCGWDGNDCKSTNDGLVKHFARSCKVAMGDISKIRDGVCDKINNIQECAYDGGDCFSFNNNTNVTSPANSNCHEKVIPCCNVANPNKVGDGVCDALGGYNSKECGNDGGDCKNFNENYATTANRNCTASDLPCCEVEKPHLLGDGVCQDGEGEYNTEGCRWDGGDCLHENYTSCFGIVPEKLGDENCDGGKYNTKECGWDGGACYISEYPDCHVDHPDRVGDGVCDGNLYNTVECGWDGGDCSTTPTNFPTKVSENICSSFENF